MSLVRRYTVGSRKRRSRRGRLAALVLLFTIGALAVPGAVTPASAAPGPRPGFHLPFPCGDLWRLDSWGHAPALDMVRAPSQNGTEGSLLIAAAAGTVNQSFRHGNAGNMVQINHGGGWFTTYLHMQSRSVTVGQQVYQGQEIGRIGRDGPGANNHPHLHFEVGVDSNGDGQASWGFAGAERVRPWLNGVEYGQANSQTWPNVYSNNCGEMPATTSSGGRMDMFVRGTNREIYQRTYTSSWSSWRSTGAGVLSSAPAAVAWTDRNGSPRIDLFANGSEKANGTTDVYWQTSWDGGNTWGGWQLIGGNLTTQPAATVLDGTLYLFGRGIDHRLFSRKLVPTWHNNFGEWIYNWNAWEARTNDRLNSAPSAATYLGQVQVWYTRQDLRAYQVFTDGGPWAGPIEPGGSVGNLTGAMGIMQWSDDFEVYGRGTDGRIYFKWYNHAGGWRDWSQLSTLGVANSGIGATNHAGHTNLFVKGSSDQIKWARWDNNGLSPWTDLGGQSL